jgi:hypothetical protein
MPLPSCARHAAAVTIAVIRRARSWESGHFHQHITNVGRARRPLTSGPASANVYIWKPYLWYVGISHRFVSLGSLIRRVSPFVLLPSSDVNRSLVDLIDLFLNTPLVVPLQAEPHIFILPIHTHIRCLLHPCHQSTDSLTLSEHPHKTLLMAFVNEYAKLVIDVD